MKSICILAAIALSAYGWCCVALEYGKLSAALFAMSAASIVLLLWSLLRDRLGEPPIEFVGGYETPADGTRHSVSTHQNTITVLEEEVVYRRQRKYLSTESSEHQLLELGTWVPIDAPPSWTAALAVPSAPPRALSTGQPSTAGACDKQRRRAAATSRSLIRALHGSWQRSPDAQTTGRRATHAQQEKTAYLRREEE